MNWTKEMGLTPSDFIRTLPNAVGSQCIEQQDLHFSVSYDGQPDKRASIQLTVMPNRRIALLNMPVTRVEIALQGFDEEQAQAFIERFDLYYHKGGG